VSNSYAGNQNWSSYGQRAGLLELPQKCSYISCHLITPLSPLHLPTNLAGPQANLKGYENISQTVVGLYVFGVPHWHCWLLRRSKNPSDGCQAAVYSGRIH
jgi:hypothetical protein